MHRYPLRATERRLAQALSTLIGWLRRWHGYEWTQRNQQQYEDEVREVMMAETWCGVDDMAAYIFAMMDIEYDGEDWT